MIGYKFSLQNVLDWRYEQEDAAKRELMRLNNYLKQEKSHLQQLIKENIRLKEKALLVHKVNVMRQQDLYKKVLDGKIIQQKLVIEQAEKEIKKAEAALLNAHRDKRVMEKLKEKEFETYREAIQLEEQRQLDEFATITYKRTAFQ